jgi:hypothetical protein
MAVPFSSNRLLMHPVDCFSQPIGEVVENHPADDDTD